MIKISLFIRTVACLLAAGGVVEAVPADSLAFPAKVRHRSGWEAAAAWPGQVVYAPFFGLFFVGRQVATAVYEKRVIDRAEALLTTADGRAGVRPLSNTSLGSGVRLFYKAAGGYRAELVSTLGRAGTGRQRHSLTLRRGGAWTLTGALLREPTEDFYGIGNETRARDKSSFALEEGRLQLQYRRRLRPGLRVGFDLGYSSSEVGDGASRVFPSIYDRYPPTALTGLGARADFATASAVVRADRTDPPGSPQRGRRGLAAAEYAHSLGEGYSHVGLRLVGEQFWPLFYRRTFALRLGTEWRWAPGSQHLPFYALAALGGPEVLRGFRRGRLRDRGAVFAAGTYKFPLARFVDGTVFAEAGQVLDAPGDFPLGRWHRAYGGSMRLWVPDGVIFEQSLVRSVEGYFLLFNFKTDF